MKLISYQNLYYLHLFPLMSNPLPQSQAFFSHPAPLNGVGVSGAGGQRAGDRCCLRVAIGHHGIPKTSTVRNTGQYTGRHIEG